MLLVQHDGPVRREQLHLAGGVVTLNQIDARRSAVGTVTQIIHPRRLGQRRPLLQKCPAQFPLDLIGLILPGNELVGTQWNRLIAWNQPIAKGCINRIQPGSSLFSSST
jgi:hypothetical protein